MPTPDHSARPLLGIDEMDAQHRYLYELFDRLGDTALLASHERTAALLAEIEGYLDFHFTSEEHLVRHYKVPGFAAHRTDHEQAAEAFVGYLNDFEHGTFHPARLRNALTGWLYEHSASTDMAYAHHIRQARAAIR